MKIYWQSNSSHIVSIIGKWQRMKSRTYFVVLVVGLSISAIVILAFLYYYNYQTDSTNTQEHSKLQVFSELNYKSPQAVKTGGLQVGSVAPDFDFVDPEKGKVSRQDFNGELVFILFSSTDCMPCIESAKNIRKYKDDNNITGSIADVLIVFVDEQEELVDNAKLMEWKKKYGKDSWYVVKADEDTIKSFNIKYLGTTYVLDSRSGVIKWTDIQPLDYTSIKLCIEYFCS